MADKKATLKFILRATDADGETHDTLSSLARKTGMHPEDVAKITESLSGVDDVLQDHVEGVGSGIKPRVQYSTGDFLAGNQGTE